MKQYTPLQNLAYTQHSLDYNKRVIQIVQENHKAEQHPLYNHEESDTQKKAKQLTLKLFEFLQNVPTQVGHVCIIIDYT